MVSYFGSCELVAKIKKIKKTSQLQKVAQKCNKLNIACEQTKALSDMLESSESYRIA